MTSIITGDIINSRSIDAKLWLTVLKQELNNVGSAPKQWEIYRGDSFQVEVPSPDEALLVCIRIKAAIKTIKGLDVRMAIGIGTKSHNANNISEANGSAFIRSGECFESLKNLRQSLGIFTGNPMLDERFNLYLKLALIAMDNWTPGAAEFVKLSLQNPTSSQTEIGSMLGISQSSVSERQQRSYLPDILEMETLFRKELKTLENLS